MNEGGQALPRLGRAAIVAAVVVGVPLRFVTSSHLWLDEALSVNIARLPIGDIPDALRHDGHPPLYYVGLHLWMSLFGEGDVAVRAFAGVFGVGALALAWWAGKRVAGAAGGWWALGLFALCPFLIRYSTETRMYALVTFLVLLAWLLVQRALEKPSLARLAPITLVVGMLLLTHYWSLWLMGATVLVLAWYSRRAGPARRVLVAVVCGGVLLVPWLPVMLDQSAHTGTPWASAVRPATMVSVSLHDIGGGDFGEAALLGITLLFLFLVGLAGRRTDDHTITLDVRSVPGMRAEAAVVGLTLAIATVVGYATHTTFASRYIAAVVPIFLLLAALGAVQVPGRKAPLVVLALLLVLGGVGAVHNVVTDRTQVGDIAAGIRERAQPGDVIVICPDQLGPSTHRVVPADLTQLVYPPSDIAPERVEWRDYADRNAAADPHAFAASVVEAAKGAHNVWVVYSGSYKTLEGQCESVVADLGTALGGGEVVVQDDSAVFEHAALLRLAGPAPAP